MPKARILFTKRKIKLRKLKRIMLEKICKKIWCKIKGHPKKDAPLIELWEASQGRTVVFKCIRCNSTLGSLWHDA